MNSACVLLAMPGGTRAATFVVVLIEIYNWIARYSEGTAAVLPKRLVLSLICVVILLFTGWKGWELVYKHRVGIADKGEGPQDPVQPRTPRAA